MGSESSSETPPPSSYAEASNSKKLYGDLEDKDTKVAKKEEDKEDDEEGDSCEPSDYPPLTEYEASFETPVLPNIPSEGLLNWICCECGKHNCMVSVKPWCDCHEEKCDKCIYYGFEPLPKEKKKKTKDTNLDTYHQLVEVLTQVLAEIAKAQ
ncbi:MAG: hypothetical protein Q9174_007067 [Haloplaca sp. 1 TL-2023]